MTASSRHPPFHTVVNPLPSVHREGKGLTTAWKGFKCPPLQMCTSSEAALSLTSTTTSTQPSPHYIVLNSTYTPVVTPAQYSPLQPQLHPIVSHHYTHNIISNHHSPLHLLLRLQLHPVIIIFYLYACYYVQSLFTFTPTITSSHYSPIWPQQHLIFINPYLHSVTSTHHSLLHPQLHPLLYPQLHPLIHSYTHSYIHSSFTLTHTVTSTHHSLLHPQLHPLIIHSYIHSYIHSSFTLAPTVTSPHHPLLHP